jgi:hypothetical protein
MSINLNSTKVRSSERTGLNLIGKTEGEELMEMGMVWTYPIKKTEAQSLRNNLKTEPETEVKSNW